MKCEVVSVMSRTPREFETYYKPHVFIASLNRFGVEPTILGLNETWNCLMTKPRRIRQWLREGHCKADVLIVADAFDVVFTAHPDAVAERWGGGDEILFNAEKDQFPPAPGLRWAFPDPGTPWRYLNGGLFIGKPANILAFYEAMNLDDIHDDHVAMDALHGGAGVTVNVNDGTWYQILFAARPTPMVLDTKCEIFQCLSSCTMEEFGEFTDGRMVNKVTGSAPLVWHFNGGAKNDLMPIFIKHWGLA